MLKDRLSELKTWVEYEVETLGLTLRFKKLTVAESQDLQGKKKKGISDEKLLLIVMSRFVSDVDGKPIVGEDDVETIESMTADVLGEISGLFAKVNGVSVEDSKKK